MPCRNLFTACLLGRYQGTPCRDLGVFDSMRWSPITLPGTNSVERAAGVALTLPMNDF
jgi:hypothetical protein